MNTGPDPEWCAIHKPRIVLRDVDNVRVYGFDRDRLPLCCDCLLRSALYGRYAVASTGRLPQFQQGRSPRLGFVRPTRLDIRQSLDRLSGKSERTAAR